MKKSKRLDILEKAVSELALELSTTIKAYNEFLEIDKAWSEKIGRAITGLQEDSNLTRCVVVTVAKELGVSPQRLLEIIQEAGTVKDAVDDAHRELADNPLADVEEVVNEIVAKMMKGGASEH